MSAKRTPEQKTSYLIAATGGSKGVLAQCFARSPEQAERAVSALLLDVFGEDCECICIDTGAAPGLWMEGSPAYIRTAITKATQGA